MVPFSLWGLTWRKKPYNSWGNGCAMRVSPVGFVFNNLESSDYEDAIRNAVSLGGDSDTIACITGGIAQAFYKGVPQIIIEKSRKKLTKRMIKILDKSN